MLFGLDDPEFFFDDSLDVFLQLGHDDLAFGFEKCSHFLVSISTDGYLVALASAKQKSF